MTEFIQLSIIFKRHQYDLYKYVYIIHTGLKKRYYYYYRIVWEPQAPFDSIFIVVCPNKNLIAVNF